MRSVVPHRLHPILHGSLQVDQPFLAQGDTDLRVFEQRRVIGSLTGAGVAYTR